MAFHYSAPFFLSPSPSTWGLWLICKHTRHPGSEAPLPHQAWALSLCSMPPAPFVLCLRAPIPSCRFLTNPVPPPVHQSRPATRSPIPPCCIFTNPVPLIFTNHVPPHAHQSRPAAYSPIPSRYNAHQSRLAACSPAARSPCVCRVFLFLLCYQTS